MSSAQLLVGVLFSNGVLLFSNFVLEHKSNPFENKTATNNWAELIRFGDDGHGTVGSKHRGLVVSPVKKNISRITMLEMAISTLTWPW